VQIHDLWRFHTGDDPPGARQVRKCATRIVHPAAFCCGDFIADYLTYRASSAK
jgi:hypothetical protein